jgi:aminopeptidase N
MEFMPAGAIDRSLDAFFEQWVYGTGIPAVSLSHSVRGKAPVVSVRATVSQSSVDDDFTAIVPIEVQLPGKRSITEWVRTADEPVTVTIAVKLQPLKIVLDPNNVILRK